MNGICLTCGITTELEPFTGLDEHHVAGRRNHAGLTVAVCRPCHDILTSWQRAAGVELAADSPRTELDMHRAMLVGAIDVLRLCAERLGEGSAAQAEVAALMGRAISRLMDTMGDPDRPGRWLPDPSVPPTDVVPVGPPSDELPRIQELAALVRELGDELDIHTARTAGLLDAVIERPECLEEALTWAFGEPRTGAQYLALHLEELDRGVEVMRRLLQVPRYDALDARLLQEALTWIDTGLALLEQALKDLQASSEGGQR